MSTVRHEHQHDFRERVSIPNKTAGAVTGYSEYTARACGERRRTILWERTDHPGSETRWTAHLFGVDLTVTRITVDQWRAELSSAAGMNAITSPSFASRQAAQQWAVGQVSR